MLTRILRIGAGRLKDERGSVGLLMALALFFVLGMLTMTYNTARISTEKMRLQNAADAAALEHAAWQARGMNMIQNLNNEGFTALKFSDELIRIAVPINAARFGFEMAAKIPGIGYIFKAFEVICYHVVKGILMAADWIANVICGKMIYYIQAFLQYVPIIGYIGAQQLAQANGAEPIGGHGAALGSLSGASYGVFALGASTSLAQTFKLPVKRAFEDGDEKTDEDSDGNPPWYTDNKVYETMISATMGTRTDLKEKLPTFKFNPMISVKLDEADGACKWELPSPCVWICFKGRSETRLMPLDVWDAGWKTEKNNKAHKRLTEGHGGIGRMIAIAAAQCVSGDVVKQSVTAKKDSFCIQRPAGLGCGATAKLVPVSQALGESIVGKLVYH